MSTAASPGRTARASDIAARFERLPLSRWHVTVRIVIGVVTFFEAFDQLLIAYTLPQLREEWDLSAGASTLTLTVGSIGMLIGALVSGRMADRFGRVRVVTTCVALTGLASLGLAFSPTLAVFLLVRFVQGLAIGGEVPVAAAFISEITRSFQRGRFVLVYELVFPAGLTLGAVVAAFVVPTAGWRWMYAVAAVPGLLAILVHRMVPESPRWLADRGRLAEATEVMDGIEATIERQSGRPLPPVPAVKDTSSEVHTAAPSEIPVPSSPATAKEKAASGFSGLFAGRYLRRTQMIWTLWFCGYFVNYGITAWLPSIYGKSYDLSLTEALWYSTVTSLTGLIGCAIAAFTIDRLGRRKVLAVGLGGGAAMLLCLALLGGQTAGGVLLWTSLAAMFCFATNISLYLYTPELYPTRMRAVGCAAGGAFNRFGIILGPIAVGAVYAGGTDIGSVFITLACVGLAGCVVAALFAEETANRPLEEVSP